jgi:hypothetical protein
MSGIPKGTELVRPFLPARDFERSKRFYERGTYSNAFTSRCLNCGIAIGTPKGPS